MMRVMEMEASRNKYLENLAKYEKLKKFMPHEEAWESVYGPLPEDSKEEYELLNSMVSEYIGSKKKLRNEKND